MACANGGTCVARVSYAHCVCPSNFVGIDCTIDYRTLPQTCNLLALWPLTSNHISGKEKLIDIAAGQHASFASTVIWPDANILYTTEIRRIPDLLYSDVGAISATLHDNHFKHQKFTVAAFVNFDLEATDYYKLYPLLSFGNVDDLSGSPVIYMSPSGDFRFYFTAFGETHHVNATFQSGEFIGIGSWTMIGMTYESFPTSYQVTFFGRVDTYGTLKFTLPEVLPIRPSFISQELWIGSAHMNETSDTARVFPGKIACLSMYKDSLDNTEFEDLYDACMAIVGDTTPVAATQTKCDVCTNPPPIDYALISEVNYKSLAFTGYSAVCPVNKRIESDPLSRSQTGWCAGSDTWIADSNCSLTMSPVQCDPMCLNGGHCYCNDTLQSCFCECQPGFTGPDCILDTSLNLIPDTVVAFWPMSSDTVVNNGNTLEALDFSPWENKLTIGSSVGMLGEVHSGGYGFTTRYPLFNSFELNPHLQDSYLFTLNPLSLNGTYYHDGETWENSTVVDYHESFVVVFFLNYHFVKSYGDLPIFGVPYNGTAIYLDHESGQFRYYPDGLLIPHTGEVLGDKLESWLLITIVFNGTSSEIGTSAIEVWDPLLDPYDFITVSTPKFNSSVFYIGNDVQDKSNGPNFAISCFGIYAQEYSLFFTFFN